MSFLAPYFLWLIPLLSIPIVIHLLNRRKIITIEFSTIKFLRMMEKESIHNLNLLQLILLILRTLIIIIIILMITRPLITGYFNISTSLDSSLHAIILDDSFSMKGNENILDKNINIILNQIPNKSDLIWINTNNGIQYNGIKENLPPIEKFIKTTFSGNNIIESINILKNHIDNKHLTTEIYLFTDSQIVINKLYENYLNLEKFHIYAIIAPLIEDNLAITNVAIQEKVLIPNNEIDINVLVNNVGIINKENVLLQLIINNISVGQQLISLNTSSAKTFNFKTSLPNPGLYSCMVELDNDHKSDDNRFYFSINIPNQRKILIMQESVESSFYIKASLDALNKNNKSLIIDEFSSLYDQNLNIYNYDAVFITSINLLKSINDSKLDEYFHSGGHLILFPNSNSDFNQLESINTIFPEINDNYRDISKNNLLFDSFQQIDLSNLKNIRMKKLFSNGTNKDRNIKVFKYFPLPYTANNSKLLLDDGSSLWNRYNSNNGILDIFAISFDLTWTNFPIKGGFLPFIHFLSYSNSNHNNKLFETIGSHWMVHPPKYYSDQIFHVSPDGSRELINYDSNNYLKIDTIYFPGHHSMATGKHIISQIAINVEREELTSIYYPIEDMQNEFSNNLQIIPMNKNIVNNIKRAQVGTELWQYILYFLVLLIMIEMFISNPLKKL